MMVSSTDTQLATLSLQVANGDMRTHCIDSAPVSSHSYSVWTGLLVPIGTHHFVYLREIAQAQ